MIIKTTLAQRRQCHSRGIFLKTSTVLGNKKDASGPGLHKAGMTIELLTALNFSSLLFSFSSLLAQNSKLIYDQLRKPNDAVYDHVPIGLCEDYPEETTTMEIIRNDMELLKRSGINLLRISFGWDGIEEEKDKYNWRFWDDYVRTAVDEYGITLIPYICYTPSWNSTGDTTNFWSHTP